MGVLYYSSSSTAVTAVLLYKLSLCISSFRNGTSRVCTKRWQKPRSRCCVCFMRPASSSSSLSLCADKKGSGIQLGRGLPPRLLPIITTTSGLNFALCFRYNFLLMSRVLPTRINLHTTQSTNCFLADKFTKYAAYSPRTGPV